MTKTAELLSQDFREWGREATRRVYDQTRERGVVFDSYVSIDLATGIKVG